MQETIDLVLGNPVNTSRHGDFSYTFEVVKPANPSFLLLFLQLFIPLNLFKHNSWNKTFTLTRTGLIIPRGSYIPAAIFRMLLFVTASPSAFFASADNSKINKSLLQSHDNPRILSFLIPSFLPSISFAQLSSELSILSFTLAPSRNSHCRIFGLNSPLFVNHFLNLKPPSASLSFALSCSSLATCVVLSPQKEVLSAEGMYHII